MAADQVTLRYHVARNGSVLSVRVEKTLGNPNFDDQAVRGGAPGSIFPRRAPPEQATRSTRGPLITSVHFRL